MKPRYWWLTSCIISAILLSILVSQWVKMNTHEIHTLQLTDQQAVEQALQPTISKLHALNKKSPVQLKTGLFIQSLVFTSASDVNLSGYIWQHYIDGVHDLFKPKDDEAGFIFPEQVMTGSDISPRLAYRYRTQAGEVLGWYFEATLRQNFDYQRYPFDHKTVWIRLWPKAFSSQLILTPDFDAYDATGVNDTFGIVQSIVLGAWDRENTYFDYKHYSYSTNFGVPDYIGQHNWPELHFNIVVKRKFNHAFIIYLLPLLLVATLLYAALLTVCDDEQLANRLGFSTSAFIGACSALFFVVMLAHIQLRERFSTAGVVYIEYFYILMYGILVAATANTYCFSVRSPRVLKLLWYRDNLLIKVAYWPVLLLAMTLITSRFC